MLVEQARREGYELRCRGPEVITCTVDGRLQEPYEAVTLDVPEEFVGVVTQGLGPAPGPHDRHGQPRHRLGAAGVPGPARA